MTSASLTLAVLLSAWLLLAWGLKRLKPGMTWKEGALVLGLLLAHAMVLIGGLVWTFRRPGFRPLGAVIGIAVGLMALILLTKDRKGSI